MKKVINSLPFFVLLLLPLLFYPRVDTSSWQSSADVHAFFEFASSLLAITAGVMVLLHYFTTGRWFFLIISIGFVQIGAEQLIHAVFSYNRIWSEIPPIFKFAISTTWLTGHFMLLASFFGALIARESKSVQGRTAFNAVVYNIIGFICSAFIALLIFNAPFLPDFVQLGSVTKKLSELTLALLYFSVLLFYLDIYLTEQPRSPLLLSIVVCIILRVLAHIFVFDSKAFYDAHWDVAHLMVFLSYFLPIFGVWGEIIKLHETAQAQVTELGKEISERKWVEEELRRNQDVTDRLAQEMAIIAEIGKVVGSTLDIEEVYESFATEVRKLIPFDRLAVNLHGLHDENVRVAYIFGEVIPDRNKGALFPLKGSVSEVLIMTRAGLYSHPKNVEEMDQCFPNHSATVQAGMRSLMGVPLIYRDEVIASLHFRSKTPNAYTEPDLRLAERIGAQIAGAIGSAQLFSDVKKTEYSLRESESRFRGLVEQAAVGVAEIKMDTGRFFTVNRRLCEMVGRSEEELLATTFQAITHPEDLQLHEEKTRMMLAGEIRHYSLEKRYLRKDGGIVWVNITVSPLWKPGEVPGRNIAVIEDITDRKRMEEEIIALSITDQLTGLHNRRGFLSLAEQQLKLSLRNKRGMLLYFADLDGLKWINDTLGHEEGDKALIEAGTVLKETFRTSDIIARLGGDEYAALAVDMNDSNSEIFTARLKSLIDARNNQENRRYRLSISVGCSYYDPENPCSIDELMASADKFMYENKQKKKDSLPQGTSLSSSTH